MSAIVLVDTSILLNVLDVPGFNQSREEVLNGFRQHIQNSDHLLLPMAAIIETGNHVAHVAHGQARRLSAQRFVREMHKALQGEAPWKPTHFPDNAQVLRWLDAFVDLAVREIGFGDLSIIKEWERTCQLYPMSRVLIWSLDRHLRGYERTC